MRNHWKRITLTLAVILALTTGGGILWARNYYYNNLKPVGGSQREVSITIPTGASVQEIADLLKQEGLIRNTRVFAQYVRNQGAQEELQAGTYAIRPTYSVQEIVTILTHGKVQKDLFTILPGQRLDQVKRALIDSGYAEGEVVAALDPTQYKDHPALVDKPAGANLEGYLYPESFQKTAQTEAATIIRQSLDEMQKNLTPDIRAGFTRQGLTVFEGVTLASIIEQEVSKTEDRSKVAQVFLKRYKIGMQLGSDVTAFYGAILEKGPEAGNNSAIAFDSPYNTRKYSGLPPGPISNVSASSLQAVTNPASTDWLYFVAGDDGVTYFSKTIQEHEALTRQHCKKLCS